MYLSGQTTVHGPITRNYDLPAGLSGQPGSAMSDCFFTDPPHLGEKAVSDTVSDTAPYPKYQNPIPYRIPQLVSDTVSNMNGIRYGIGFAGIRYGIRCADIQYGIEYADIRYGIEYADIRCNLPTSFP